ncbi:MAG: preprotein translocase subunit SecA [bacterium]|nr:preprotein translocase subunit SecA [bacterium]
MSFLTKIFGDANERYIKSARLLVEEINKFEPQFEKFSNEEIKNKTIEFKKRITEGETLDQILPESFALVREAARRTVKQRHYDVQLVGGIVLHQGKIAEMKTGEGKTLTATLPVYLNALTGQGVHLVTVNDYLSRRDTAWMGEVYDLLGLTVACLNHDSSYLYDSAHVKEKEEELDKTRDELGSFKVVHEFLRPIGRREAYLADITYGTNNEFGFDYLRDNMVFGLEQKVQAKGHNFSIVDEVDSILIDEARTPLIISSPDSDSTKLYQQFAHIVPHLKENEDYNIDEKLKAVTLTEKGIEKVEKQLGVGNIYEEGGVRYVHHLEQALRAQVLFKLDRDYVVKEGEVIIVDEFTGRLMPGRRWSDGLHQAVEAKEGVSVQKESRTMATITFQNYFRLYKKLSGMTGTASTSAEEFHKVYNLDAINVPPNKPFQRKDLPDSIFKTEAGKFRAIVREIKERNEKGQPVLVGTVSIEKNELLSKMLERDGISHHILNAKNHEKEGEIIAQAGKFGAVTVATNMAGRGVDIILGGVPVDAQEGERVRQVSGLHVIGTERHEARRIDNQLRGRAGRQGDPGSSQFFVSTEDDLARVFGGDRLKNLMDRLGVGEDDAIENRFVSRAIEQAQAKIEGFHFDSRKYVLEYDDVMNRHRTAIYGLRNKILENQDNHEIFSEYFDWAISRLTEVHTQNVTGEWNIEEIAETIKILTGSEESIHSKLIELSKTGDLGALKNFLLEFVAKELEKKEKELGIEQMHRLENLVLLRVIDELWVDHLEAMEYLRESVRLRAYGQRDPLVEYKIEGQRMFEELLQNVKMQAVNTIFRVSFIQQPKTVNIQEGRDNSLSQSENSEPEEKSAPAINSEPKVGRNDPCWCNSGKKYKRCHGA